MLFPFGFHSGCFGGHVAENKSRFFRGHLYGFISVEFLLTLGSLRPHLSFLGCHVGEKKSRSLGVIYLDLFRSTFG